MKDIRIAQLLTTAPVTSVDVADQRLRTLRIRGKDFVDVKYIIFSNQRIETFTIESTSSILFQIPPAPLDLRAPIRVIVGKSRRSGEGAISLSLNTSSAIQGDSRIVQKFFKILLTKKGSNVFNRAQGTLLVHALGGNISSPLSIVHSAVDDAVQQLMTGQEGKALPSNETLVRVTVLDSNFDVRRASIDITLEIETADGIAQIAEVQL